MNIDTNAYLALGGFFGVLIITIGLTIFVLARKR